MHACQHDVGEVLPPPHFDYVFRIYRQNRFQQPDATLLIKGDCLLKKMQIKKIDQNLYGLEYWL
jgi:hypothetical protein